MKKIIQGFLKKMHYKLVKTDNAHSDFIVDGFKKNLEMCKPYSMCSSERMFSLYSGVHYVLDNNIQGDFVECGVWKGGSAMLIAKILLMRGVTNRQIYLYDTFEGMTAPTRNDKDLAGVTATSKWESAIKENEASNWCHSPLDEVKENMTKTGYDMANIQFVKGKVEDTIPATIPKGKIALLRLDTDWYESTLHELIHLYPMLIGNGVLIIDDYGHWAGCRKAVDEYFAKEKINMLLHRVDYTCRSGIKNVF